MRQIKSFLPLVLILFTAGCINEKDVSLVGSIHVTKGDISMRAKVSEIYYPDSGKEYVGLAQLIKGYLSEEVLRSLGYKVDDAVLEGEAKRIDDSTKAPDTLKKIKAVYGRDRKGYIKTFVRVVYAERFLYNEAFLKSSEIHKEQYQKAEGFLKASIKSPGKFKDIAAAMGLEALRLRLSIKDGMVPIEEGKAGHPRSTTGGQGIEQAKRLIDAVSNIKRGEVYPEVIQWREGYQIIRYIKKTGEDYIIESTGVQKMDYDKWFWEKAAQIKVKVYDERLKDELLKEVNWTRQLNLNPNPA